MSESQRQIQEFWDSIARSWGKAADSWLGQCPRSNASIHTLQEAAFAAMQIWMRLPVFLLEDRQPDKLREAISQFTQAQSRLYQLWREAFNHTEAREAAEATLKPAGTERKRRRKPTVKRPTSTKPTGRGRKRRQTLS